MDRPSYDLKYEYIPPASRSDFYKLIQAKSEGTVSLYCFYREASVVINRVSTLLYNSDDIESYFSPDYLIELLLNVEWHEFLSITEFVSNEADISIDEINDIFEYHRVGYRLEKDPQIRQAKAVVHYDTLIEHAEALLVENIKYEGVRSSIETARELLSNPKENNVESAVKASVDAVEGYLHGWLISKGHKVSTLNDSIQVLKRSKLAPLHIINSLHDLYIFRNSEPNVGHGHPEKGNLQRNDALLCFQMAVSFINYFYRKGQKGE